MAYKDGLVSIITPAYHSEATIAESVKSVLAQTYTNWELVISSDDGVDYKKVLAEKGINDPRIRFVSTGSVGTGAAHARNVALEKAEGKIITLLDSDDTFSKDKLELSVPLTKSHPLVTCGIDLINHSGKHMRNIGCSPILLSGKIDAAKFLKHNYSGHSMIVYDRSKLGDLRYDETLPALEDYEFLTQCFAKASTVYHIAKPLYHYVKNKTANPNAAQKCLDAEDLMINRLTRRQHYTFSNQGDLYPFIRFFEINKEACLKHSELAKSNPNLVFEDIVGPMLAKADLRPAAKANNRIKTTEKTEVETLLGSQAYVNWADIPQVNDLKELEDVAKAEELLSKVEEYHQIPKDKLETLSQRRQALLEISDFIGEGESLPPDIRGIGKVARSKAKYIESIEKLYNAGVLVDDERVYDHQKVAEYFEKFDYQCGWEPFFLNNRTFFDGTEGRFWGGDYQLEAIDPSHRQLDHFLKEWQRERKAGDKTPFFLWMERSNVAPTVGRTRFYTEEELRKNEVTVKSGRIYVGGKPFTSGDSETLFVVTPDHHIYTTRAAHNIRHMTLSHGKPLISVGSWEVANGEIKKLTSDSGHYLPNEKSRQVIKVLRNEGLRLSDSSPFAYFDKKGSRIETTIGAYMGSEKIEKEGPAATKLLTRRELQTSDQTLVPA